MLDKQLELFEDYEPDVLDVDIIDISKINIKFVGEKEMHRKSNIMIEKLNAIQEGKYFLHKNIDGLPYVIGPKNNKLTVNTTRNQYPCIGIGGVVIAMHRLVALAFIKNDDTSKKLEVDHINDDKSDFRVSNLQWVTNGFNSKKAQSRKRDNNAI
jgi:hypothetical protein